MWAVHVMLFFTAYSYVGAVNIYIQGPVKVSECRAVGSTTKNPNIEELPLKKKVPAGFEDHHGRFIRRTISSDPQGLYDVVMGYCEQFHAVPFIPRTEADHSLYKEVVVALGKSMWVPANDRASEGTLMWYTNPEEEVAQADIALLDWWEGNVMDNNDGSNDCLRYVCCYGVQPGVSLTDCTYIRHHPPICELSE